VLPFDGAQRAASSMPAVRCLDHTVGIERPGLQPLCDQRMHRPLVSRSCQLSGFVIQMTYPHA